jgi:nicotinamidase-related amidase
MDEGPQDTARICGPAPGGAALLVIDMINDLDYPGSKSLVRAAEAIAPTILALRDAADELRVPVVYVNDNFGQWHSERSRLVEHCTRPQAPARQIAERLSPRDGDYFVIKPQFSGFYATNLQVLLPKLGVSRLILSGMAADVCVLFTAADAHMRDYDLWVPSNAVAGEDPKRAAWALEIMASSMGARTTPCALDDLTAWLDEVSV